MTLIKPIGKLKKHGLLWQHNHIIDITYDEAGCAFTYYKEINKTIRLSTYLPLKTLLTNSEIENCCIFGVLKMDLL